MTYFEVYIQALGVIVAFMTIIWFISILIKNASIVDIFWGVGFVVAASFYFLTLSENYPRQILLMTLVSLWGLRLAIYLSWRNIGKEEDYRYQKFRQDYGPKRYWWVSYFQVFLLQGVLMWLISAPLLGVMFYTRNDSLNAFDYIGVAFWIIGFYFETVGDIQMAKFKANPANKGKVMKSGLWKYTRHPNYFGDASVWWGYGFICIAAGSYIPVLGSILMTLLIIKVSGVSLLEKSLKDKKPEYKEYVENTSAFIPWFPKNS